MNSCISESTQVDVVEEFKTSSIPISKIYVRSSGTILCDNVVVSVEELDSIIFRVTQNDGCIYYSKNLEKIPPVTITRKIMNLFVVSEVRVELYLDSLFSNPAIPPASPRITN